MAEGELPNHKLYVYDYGMAEDWFLGLFFLSLLLLIVGTLRPVMFAPIFRGLATRGKLALIFSGASLLFLVLFGVFANPSSNSQTDKETVERGQVGARETAERSEVKQAAQSAPYEIAKAEDNSLKALERPLSDYTTTEIEALPLNKRKSYSVIVSPDITSAQVEPTAQLIVDEEVRKDPDIDEIYILFYSDREIVGASGAYDVAAATWAPGGKWGSTTPQIARGNDRSSHRLVVNVKDNLEAYLQQRGTAEEKFGLPEIQRREIFKAITKAEERARAEADAKYPVDATDPTLPQDNVTKNASLNQELIAKYHGEVREEYKISEDVQWEVISEAIEKHWPAE